MRWGQGLGITAACVLTVWACASDDKSNETNEVPPDGGRDGSSGGSAGTGASAGEGGGGTTSAGGSTSGGSSGSSMGGSGGSSMGGSSGAGAASAGGASGASAGGSAGASGAGGSAGAGGVSMGGAGGTMSDAGACEPLPDGGCLDGGLTGPQEAYIKPDILDNVELGRWISLDGDTLVAGSTSRDNPSGPEGGALVFVRDCAGWRQQAVLVSSMPEVGDLFGANVAVSGDTIVVGAPGEDAGGAVYVFERCGDSWNPTARLTPDVLDSDDSFGASVAIDGDLIVVGAPEEDSSTNTVDSTPDNDASNAGAAYVFQRGGSSWSQVAYLKADNAESGDSFGVDVAISGTTIVVGAEGEDSAGTDVDGDRGNDPSFGSDSGAAYVFVEGGGTWSQQAYLKANASGANKSFGESVAIDADTVVVGALDETGTATGVDGDPSLTGIFSSGAAYVFFRSSGTWAPQAYLKPSNVAGNHRFGSSVAVSGDTIYVGAPQEDGAATGIDGDDSLQTVNGSGAVWSFSRSGMTWMPGSYIKASNTGPGDVFGTDVSASGDTFVVGAQLEDSDALGIDGDQDNNNQGNSGAIYVFRP